MIIIDTLTQTAWPPCLIEFGNYLVCAYHAQDASIGIMYSSDGMTWNNLNDSTGQQLGKSPALAVYQNNLYCAFNVNNGSADISLISTSNITIPNSWIPSTSIGGSSLGSLSLCNANGVLCSVFQANNSTHELLSMVSSDNWVGNNDCHQASSSAASLAWFKDSLWCAFTKNSSGSDILTISSTDGMNWPTTSYDTGQCSISAPSLCVFNDFLYCAFQSHNDRNDLLYMTSGDGKTWSSNNTRTGLKTASAPSLATFNGHLYCAYIANDGSNDIFIAQLA